MLSQGCMESRVRQDQDTNSIELSLESGHEDWHSCLMKDYEVSHQDNSYSKSYSMEKKQISTPHMYKSMF